MIVKIRELIGTSDKSFEDALKNVIDHELKAGKNVTGAKVISQSVDVKNGVLEYKINANVAYIWEDWRKVD